MSVKALTWAFEQTVGSQGAKFVLVALANFSDESGYCYPSQRIISEMTECARRSVGRYLETLENVGLIARSPRRRDDGSYTSDGFQLNFKHKPVANLASGQSDHRPNSVHPVANLSAPSGQSLAQHEPSLNRNEPSLLASSDESLLADATGSVEQIFTNTGKEWPVSKRFADELTRAYPAVDVPATLKEIRVWSIANKRKRKTANGMPAFINSWMGREQNRG